jgi:hypothetical protein
MLYVFLFSFAALQMSRHKIFLCITNIDGAFDLFHRWVTRMLLSKYTFSCNREEEEEEKGKK